MDLVGELCSKFNSRMFQFLFHWLANPMSTYISQYVLKLCGLIGRWTGGQTWYSFQYLFTSDSACNLQSFNVLKFFLFLTAKTGHWYNIFLLIKSWLIKFSGILFQSSCENEVLAKMKKEPCCTTTGLGGWVSSQLCQWYCRRPQKG